MLPVAEADNLLEVRDLQVEFRLHPAGTLRVVDDVSFRIRPAATVALVGESGSGKSVISQTIMRILPRSARITAGSIVFHDPAAARPAVAGKNGIDIAALDADSAAMRDIRGGRIAMIFQEPMTSLNPAYTIGNQLEEALLRHRKVSRAEARQRAIFLLEKVGITAAESRLRQYPHQLSGGLRQRVMIAMTLMCGPDLIIADEPTTALDVTIQAQILLLLAELQKEFHMGLILITHDLGVVARVADRVAVMYAGQLVEHGSAKQVFGNPAHPYTQGLLDCIPIPGKTARGAHLGSIPGIVPSLVGSLSGCRFADRCAFPTDECVQKDIDFRAAFEGGHTYRCVLSPETCAKNAERRLSA